MFKEQIKFIFIFLNNKLITCDTILPFVVDLKKHNPGLKIKFITFDLATLDIINKNTNLINIINEYGTINVLGWLKNDYISIVRIFFKVTHILKIILFSLLFNCKNIHFKGLERFPFNLIYLFNKKKTFLFESNCWGYSLDVVNTDKMFYVNRIAGEEIELKSYNYLVAFSEDWPQLKFYNKNNKNKKNKYLISSTRISENWLNICKKQANILSHNKPEWMSEKFKNNKKIIYVLGYLGKFNTIHKDSTGESLLYDTLVLILKNTNHIILLKPHAITDISLLTSIINKINTNRIFITYNHMAVISHYCNYALANYFSYALTDAWVNGLKTIEYTIYDEEVLSYTGGKSIEPKYIDNFINDKPEELLKELNEEYIKFKRNHSLEFSKNSKELIKVLVA